MREFVNFDSDYITSLGRPFVAHRLRRLSELFVDGYAAWLPRFGVIAPARSLSTLILLSSEGPLGVTELADKLQLSHPLLIKLTGQLSQLGLVETRRDLRDRRRRPIQLTSEGKAEAKRILDAVTVLDRAYDELFQEVKADVLEILAALESACNREDFSLRLARNAGERQF